MEPTSLVTIIRVADGEVEELDDEIAAEATFTLLVNGNVLVSLLCTPCELDAMAVGFLLAEGFLLNRDSLLGVTVDEERAAVKVELRDFPADWDKAFHRKAITSGCGHGITFTDPGSLHSLPPSNRIIPWLTPPRIRELLHQFRDSSTLYKNTGGVHSAALAGAEGIVLFSEDIGRHNAVDKLLGKAFLADMPMGSMVLLSSGRISGEIMTKVIRSRIPVLISRTAPTCMSITHAEHHGVTLVGFARGNRMNVYTHPLRIAF